MDRATALGTFADAIEASRARPAEFLAVWKAGVERIGPEYFRISASSIAAATDRAEMTPNFDVIEHALPGLSRGQRRFLIAMCQFYADSTINAICEENGVDVPTHVDLVLLDDDMRSILVRLLNAYTGW